MSIDLLFPAPDVYPSEDLFLGWDIPPLVRRALATLEPILGWSDESDVHVANLITSLMAGDDELGIIAWGSDLGPWRGLLDPSVCPGWALPYAAQVTFAEMPPRLSGETDAAYEERARAAVLNPPQRNAGAHAGIVDAARPYLTGTRAVKIVQHVGDEWHMQVRVRDDEIIDGAEAALEAAVTSDYIVLAGVKVELVPVTPGDPWDLAEMEDTYADRTLADLEADFASLSDFETHPGGL